MINPYLPFPAEIIDIHQETSIDYTYRLAWSGEARFGQFFEVSIPRYGEAPISICDIGEGVLEMTLRNVGRVTRSIFELKPGDRLFLRGPYGNGFPLEDFAGTPLVITAGGTGLAPVKGLINHFLTPEHLLPSLHILLGFKTPGDILFGDDITRWSAGASMHITVDKPDAGWCGPSGVVTNLFTELTTELIASAQYIVVGPPIMMACSIRQLRENGVELERIWVSYERRMSCGIGKCGHCKINDRYVCLDGPVFNLTDAQWLLD